MPTELERRRLAWEALSELFLDTETNLDTVLAGLRRSGWRRAEMEAIMRNEVAPVLGGNVLSMAGEWAGFDLTPIEERYLAGRARPTLTGWLALRVVRGPWRRVLAALD